LAGEHFFVFGWHEVLRFIYQGSKTHAGLATPSGPRNRAGFKANISRKGAEAQRRRTHTPCGEYSATRIECENDR
jgi:hypothetical protein